MNTKQKKRLLLLLLVGLALLLAACGPSEEEMYDQAKKDIGSGNYAAAIKTLEELGSYEDSGQYLRYARAMQMAEGGNYAPALEAFAGLKSFYQSESQLTYYTARQAEAERRYDDALAVYQTIFSFRDSKSRFVKLRLENSIVKNMMLMPDDDLVLLPQPDGSLKVHKLDESASIDNHVAFLKETDWRQVSQYDPQTGTLVYKDGTAINSMYPWRKWTNVKRAVGTGQPVFLLNDGTLRPAVADVDVPEWTRIADAWCDDYGSIFVGVTADGRVVSQGLPEEWAKGLSRLRDIRNIYYCQEMFLALDKKGNVHAVSPTEEGLSGNVTEMFGGTPVKEIIYYSGICAALREDGTIFLPEGIYPEGALKEVMLPENYEAIKTWKNVRQARFISLRHDNSDDWSGFGDRYAAMLAMTGDGELLADGIGEASKGWNDLLRTQQLKIKEPQYETEEYVQRAAYRQGIEMALHYVALIGQDGVLNGDGDVHDNDYLYHGLDGWEDIVSLDGSHSHLVGLKEDGTVIALGRNINNQCEVDTWWNITEVAAGNQFSVGLTEYGLIAYAGRTGRGVESCRQWSDVIAIDACENHVMGLKADGTALSTAAENKNGYSEVLSWSHLVDIAAGENYSAAGILLDGSVVATPDIAFHRPGDFANLEDIIISGSVLYGLRSDGTVVASDEEAAGQVEAWTDVVQISGVDGALIGMKKDGSLLWTAPSYTDLEFEEMLASWNYYTTNEDEGNDEAEPLFYDSYAVRNLLDGDSVLANEAAPAAAGDGFAVAVLRSGKLFMTDGAPQSLKDAQPEKVNGVSAYGRQVVVLYGDGSCKLYTDAGVEELENADKVSVSAGHLLMVQKEQEYYRRNMVFSAGDNTAGQCDTLGMAAATDVAAGGQHSVVLFGGNYPIALGDNRYGQCNVDQWFDVKQLAAGERHTLGMTRDGRVLAAGDNGAGQCNVSAWDGKVKMIVAGDFFSAGMTADGRVLLTGKTDAALKQALAWERIVYLAAGPDSLVGVDASGRLHSTHADVSSAEEIQTNRLEIPRELREKLSLPMVYDSLDAGPYCCIALLEDGRVIRNEFRYRDTMEDDYYVDEHANGEFMKLADKPVAMVSAVRGGAVLYEDGTVQAVSQHFPEAAEWTNIVRITGNCDLLGALSADGQVYLSGDVSDELAAQVAQWPALRSLQVDNKSVYGVTDEGYMVSGDPKKTFDPNVWYNLVDYRGGIGVRSDGTTTHKEADGRQPVDCAEGWEQRLVLYDDGTVSADIPGVEYPVVQIAASNDCFILQMQDGSVTLSRSSSVTKDVQKWAVAMPRGVEKIVIEEEALPDGVPGTATYRPYNRLSLQHGYLLAVLPDGRVLKKGEDKWLRDEETREWIITEHKQEILDETIWYDIVEVQGTSGLRKDGTVVSIQGYKNESVVVEELQNVKKLLDYGDAAILQDGSYVSIRNGAKTQAPAGWTDLVDVQSNVEFIAGLRSDGTVLTDGMSEDMAAEIARWRNIVQIAGYYDNSIGYSLAGLTADGTVLLAGLPAWETLDQKKPAKQLITYGDEIFIVCDDDTVEDINYSGISLYDGNSNIVEFVTDGYCGIGLKADGWMVFGVTIDSAKQGFFGNYYGWNIDGININTLEGVVVR